MIGEKKLQDVKASIREAFARKGVDVNRWLDEQMAKLRRQQETSAAESLGLIRDGLGSAPARKKSSKKKTPAAVGRQPKGAHR